MRPELFLIEVEVKRIEFFSIWLFSCNRGLNSLHESEKFRKSLYLRMKTTAYVERRYPLVLVTQKP